MKIYKLWLMVTQDELSLPIVVADSLNALANKLGVDPSAITHSMKRNRDKGQYPRYVSVEYTEEDE